MAKRNTNKKALTHAVCGRTFRTKNGLKTHVICEPIAKNTPAPAVTENAPAQVSAEKQLIQELTLELMREHEIGFVKANIRARAAVAAL
jgi:hypothetical protein